jgi:hypothetical protein
MGVFFWAWFKSLHIRVIFLYLINISKADAKRVLSVFRKKSPDLSVGALRALEWELRAGFVILYR